MFNNKQNHFSNTALTSLLTTILLLSANAVMSAESTQRDILLALYNDTNGSAWTNNTDWLGAEGTECSWFGVQCDGESNVTRLDLHQNNLVGSIPTAIGSLTTLEYLDFGGNQISGTVPDSIAQLTNLDGIYLWGNQFSGSLPSFFGGMTQLSHFSLGANQFSGEIPESYGNLVNLLDLDLAHNQLTGNIPSTLSNLSIANRIDLNNNQLSGTVPAQVIALGTVNLWANPSLIGIAFGDPAACSVQTALTVGAQVGGALVPFEDCYINDEDGPLMADFYRLDLSAASDTTLIKIDAHSDFYYPHVGVLDSDGTEGEDIVETQIEQNSLSFEVALAPGEYVLYIHGGSYQPQNVAATGAYTFSTQAIAELQSGCLRFGSTWANLGVKFDAALTETDCVTTINDTSILNESYMLSLQQNQSVQVVAQSEIASQFRIFNESGFVNGSPIGLPNIPYSVSFTAGQSGRYRVVMYNTLNNSLETGAYNLEIGTVPESNVDQRTALIALYNATAGDNWTNNTNWLGAEGTECSWFGVQCDFGGNVSNLTLRENNLIGSLPSELASLSALQNLDLGGNQLSGTIPSNITQLLNLKFIYLWGNQYTGSLPLLFGEMPQLQRLSFGGNQFSGTIPSTYGNLVNIIDLDLAYNQLSGTIPSELGNLVNATSINLRQNQLSGAVPAPVLALGTVNLWANPNLTGIAFGDPAACDNQTALTLGAQAQGELTPFEDCYFDDERIMADFYRLDLSGESGTTLFKIDAYSDHYYPHIGVLDANGNDGQDIVDTQIQQNGLSFEVALTPGEYVLYIHGGSYQPQNVAATGVYTLSTTVINQSQIDCVAPTWVAKGVALDAALSSDDCLDTYNDPDRLYDSYKIWLEQGESVIVALTAEFESQILHFNGNDFFTSTPSTPASQQQVLTFTATGSGWHRYAVYASNNNPLAEGNYNIQFVEPPVFGDAQACTEGLSTIALGGSTSGAALDRNTDCYIAGRMSDRYALSLDSDTLFRATMDANGFTPLLSIYNAGAAEPITLNGNSQSNFTAEFYLAAGEYWLAASSGASNGLAPIEGSYELSLTASLPISQLQDSCMVTTTVFAGASLAGEVNTNDCRNGFVADVEARQYFDGYEFTVGAGEIMYPELTVDFSVSLSHWFNGAFQKQYFVGAGEDVRITINTAGTHELYVMGRSVNDLGSYQLDLFQTQPDLDTIPIAFSFAFTDFRNVVDGVVQTGSSDHVLTGIVDAVMVDDDVFEVISLREAALDGNAYVLGDVPGIVALRANQPALLSLSGNLLDVLVCPGGFGATNDCPFGEEGGFLISEFWSPVAQGGALAGHPTLGAAYRDRSIPLNKAGWSANLVTESASQRDTLVDLYNSTGGDNWTNKTNWLGAEGTECSWYGVQCDGNENVTQLSLERNNLVGSIPAALGNLLNATTINLSNNQLTGTVPAALYKLDSLETLNVAGNNLAQSSVLVQFSYTFDATHGGTTGHVLSGLVDGILLDDEDTVLVTGVREASLGGETYAMGEQPGLRSARLGVAPFVSLSGDNLDFWVCPGGFTDNDCSFGGQGGFLVSDRWSLTGATNSAHAGHPTFGFSFRDSDRPINRNNWVAQILGSNQHDILITLYNATGGDNWTNKTNWLGAEGTECSWYGVQCDGDNKVTALDLNQNNLVGSIPSALGDLSTMQFISLGGNQLSGAIPNSIAQLENLRGIFLWSNQFNGSLPEFFSQMTQLRNLNLSGNQFTGTIPASYGNLVNMLDLDLAFNQLSGSIPAELGNLVDATKINLQANQLSGAVPTEVQALGVVNLWANTNLTGIEFGDPVACDSQTALTLGAQVPGELTPFEDCYLDDERIMVDFYRLDLSGESGTTLFKIDAYSDHYYPHVGVLDANGIGDDGRDIVDTQIQQNGLSFEVALAPGEYVLYIHGGSYQPQNVAATGAYTLSTTIIGQAQIECVAPTWVNKGVELSAALNSEDCFDTYNDQDRRYDSYNIWLEEGESLITTVTADFESQVLHFADNDFISSTLNTAVGQQQVLTYSAPYSGWHRYAVYPNNNTPLAEGDYTIAFFEPPVFGSVQACTENLPELALGGSTSDAVLDQDTDCYIAGRMSDRYALSLDNDTLFRATMNADGYSSLLSIYNAGAGEPITLNGNNQSNFTAEFYLAAGEYWLAASSLRSNGLAPLEGSYELSLSGALPLDQLQESCIFTTTVFAGASLLGEISDNDCRDGFVVDVETRPYFDGYEFTMGAGEILYPALTVDFPAKLAHWSNGVLQQQYLVGAGDDVRITINTEGTHELYVIAQSANDLGSYQLDLLKSQSNLDTIPIAFSFAFTDFSNVVDGVVQTGPSDHVLTGVVDAVMAGDDVFEVVGIREAALDGNNYVIGDAPGIVAVRPNKPALLSLSGNLLDVLICPNGFGDVNDCPFGSEGGFLISDFWPTTGSTAGQGRALAGHVALGASYRDRSGPINKAGWSANLVTESASQRDILIALYNSTGGDSWSNKTAWLGAVGTECNWYGVQCDGDNKVTALDLNENNLVGSIPAELGSLNLLRFVSLGGNQLSGTIPNSIAQLENLEGFWLWGNQLSGSVPEFFGQLTQLRYLYLSGNQLSGNIPVSFGDLVNILELDLSHNSIEGQIPVSLGNLSNATRIRLDNNNLTGDIPQAVIDLGTVNLWANAGLNIMIGSPAACVAELSLVSGESINGELIPYTDCYLPERNVMADYYSLDLSDAVGTTLISVEADSQAFWPSIGILDASGETIEDVMADRSGQPPFSVQAALVPGQYVLFIHGGNYSHNSAPRVPAIGTYSFSLSQVDELQVDCRPFLNTWVTKGAEIGGALSSNDCVDNYNDLNRLYDEYTIWLEQGESVRIDAQSEIASQVLVFNEADFVAGSQNGVPNVSYSMRFTASQSGWYRMAMYNAAANGGATGAYSISFTDAPAFSADERAALISLYDATDGANWSNKSGWLGAEGTECSWFGVNCDGYGVVELNLIGNGLAGTIPATLSQLSQLRALRLQNNQLTGSIPAELSELENLTGLFLFKNQLSGTIPGSFGQLSNLTHLYLQQNLLSGSIPTSLGQLSNLIQLFAFENELSGSIPSELGQLSNLAVLGLRDNQLSGAIPAELGQLSSLVTLILSSNSLSGEIPAALGQLSNLEYLYLTANQLSGSIPTVLTQLSKLTTLDLSNNNLTGILPEFAQSVAVNVEGNSISAEPVELSAEEKAALLAFYNATGGANWTNSTGWLGAQGTECSWFGVGCENGKVVSISLPSNALAGTLPSSLSQFGELRNLVLNNNQLSGSIPVELAQLSKLSYLSLAANQLSGAIPVQFGQLANLTRLFLNQNQLTGAIPSGLGQLSNLTHLYLHQNELSGSIPSSLGQLSNLVQLFAHENQLTGSIPSSLGQLSKMTHLVLSFNSLSGEIPTELGQLTSLQKLFARGNQFTGAIPTELAQLSNLTELYLADNQLSGSIPSTLTQLNKLTILDLENNNLTGALPAFSQLVAVNVDGNSLDVPPTQQVYLNGVSKVFKGVFNNLPILYNVTDGDANLTGVGFHIYYDSTQVDSIAFASLLNTSLLASDDSGAEDSNDSDNDPSTDRFITIGWTDVSGNWPGSLPVKLFDLRVKLDDAMSANDQLVLNFVRSTNTTGYELELPQLSLAVSTETLDVDGNGKAEALTDGLLVIRRMFGFSGAVLIDRAIADDAVLTTAEAIVARVQQMESILDVDGDGKVEALTDGLLIIRYLFGFRGNVLVANAIGSGAARTTASQIEEYLAALVP